VIALGSSPVISPILAAGFAALGSGAAQVAGSAINDNRADNALGPPITVSDLSNAKGEFKIAMLSALDLAHNATFSNSYAGSYKGAEVSFPCSIY
jgi:hypothetical protein